MVVWKENLIKRLAGAAATRTTKTGFVSNVTLQPLFCHGQRKWADPKCLYFVIFRSLPTKTKSAELNE